MHNSFLKEQFHDPKTLGTFFRSDFSILLRIEQVKIRNAGSILPIKSFSMISLAISLCTIVFIFPYVPCTGVYYSKQYSSLQRQTLPSKTTQSWIIKNKALFGPPLFSTSFHLCDLWLYFSHLFLFFSFIKVHIFPFHIVVTYFERKASRNETIDLDF